VVDGENTDVVIEIDVAAATETLYAMLHTDVGEVGTYEFPGDDVPVTADGEVVTPSFTVTGGLAAAMPETGVGSLPWTAVLLSAGAAALLVGTLLSRRREEAVS
jgi:hypothetical protein